MLTARIPIQPKGDGLRGTFVAVNVALIVSLVVVLMKLHRNKHQIHDGAASASPGQKKCPSTFGDTHVPLAQRGIVGRCMLKYFELVLISTCVIAAIGGCDASRPIAVHGRSLTSQSADDRVHSESLVRSHSLVVEPATASKSVFEGEESIDYDFKILNPGDRTIHILSISPSCSCTVAQLSSDTILPGESVNLRATYNVGSYFDELPKRKIVFRTDHPDFPSVECELGGCRQRRYKLSPAAIDLGRVDPDTVAQGEITIESDAEYSDLDFDRSTVSSPFVSARLLQSEITATGSRHRILVELQKEAPNGPLDANLFVPLRSNAHIGPHIHVRAKVAEPWRAEPSITFFGVIGKKDKTAKVQVRLVSCDIPAVGQSGLSAIAFENLPKGIKGELDERDPTRITLVANAVELSVGKLSEHATISCKYGERTMHLNIGLRALIVE